MRLAYQIATLLADVKLDDSDEAAPGDSRVTPTKPAGFVTDFASVPRPVQWLVPVSGRWTLVAVLHDRCCMVGIVTGAISARDTDGLVRRVMRERGVPLVRRWLMWAGVRCGVLVNPVRRAGWWRDAPLWSRCRCLPPPRLSRWGWWCSLGSPSTPRWSGSPATSPAGDTNTGSEPTSSVSVDREERHVQ